MRFICRTLANHEWCVQHLHCLLSGNAGVDLLDQLNLVAAGDDFVFQNKGLLVGR